MSVELFMVLYGVMAGTSAETHYNNGYIDGLTSGATYGVTTGCGLTGCSGVVTGGVVTGVTHGGVVAGTTTTCGYVGCGYCGYGDCGMYPGYTNVCDDYDYFGESVCWNQYAYREGIEEEKYVVPFVEDVNAGTEIVQAWVSATEAPWVVDIVDDKECLFCNPLHVGSASVTIPFYPKYFVNFASGKRPVSKMIPNTVVSGGSCSTYLGNALSRLPCDNLAVLFENQQRIVGHQTKYWLDTTLPAVDRYSNWMVGLGNDYLKQYTKILGIGETLALPRNDGAMREFYETAYRHTGSTFVPSSFDTLISGDIANPSNGLETNRWLLDKLNGMRDDVLVNEEYVRAADFMSSNEYGYLVNRLEYEVETDVLRVQNLAGYTTLVDEHAAQTMSVGFRALSEDDTKKMGELLTKQLNEKKKFWKDARAKQVENETKLYNNMKLQTCQPQYCAALKPKETKTSAKEGRSLEAKKETDEKSEKIGVAELPWLRASYHATGKKPLTDCYCTTSSGDVALVKGTSSGAGQYLETVNRNLVDPNPYMEVDPSHGTVHASGKFREYEMSKNVEQVVHDESKALNMLAATLVLMLAL